MLCLTWWHTLDVVLVLGVSCDMLEYGRCRAARLCERSLQFSAAVKYFIVATNRPKLFVLVKHRSGLYLASRSCCTAQQVVAELSKLPLLLVSGVCCYVQ